MPSAAVAEESLAVGAVREDGKRWSGSRWVLEDTLLQRLKLSPEVAAYLDARGFAWPTTPPLIKTPEPRDVAGAAFSFERVDKVVVSLRALRHTQGPLAGKPLEPGPWQVAYFIAPVFGWVREDPRSSDGYVRIIRNATVDVPRKNGKSTISGGLAMYLTAADGESGAQVIAAATTRDQAGFVFDPVKHLAEKSPALSSSVRALKSRITHPRTGSYFQVVSSTADAQHGANIHGAVIDEIHLHKTPDLIEALETGTGSRLQPLIVKITTADEGRPDTPYAQNRAEIEKLANRIYRDPGVYGVIFAAPDNADPFSPKTWLAANPGAPVSPTLEYLEAAATKAKNNPTKLADFKRLHLGIRVGSRKDFLPLSSWKLNSGGPIREADLAGRRAYGGIDLAAVSDLTALCWLFPYEDGREGYDALWRFWVPEDTLPELDDRTSGAAQTWVDRGYLTLTPGNVTDYDFVKSKLQQDMETFQVESIGIDRWNATQFNNDLVSEGAPMVQVGQGYRTMSPALNEVKRLVMKGTRGKPGERVPGIRHGGNPVMRWCVNNLVVDMDPAGNVKPSKAKSTEKIDGVSALCDAMSEAMVQAETASVYETQGVWSV